MIPGLPSRTCTGSAPVGQRVELTHGSTASVLHPPGHTTKRESVTAGPYYRHGCRPTTRSARIHGLNASAATSCFREQDSRYTKLSQPTHHVSTAAAHSFAEPLLLRRSFELPENTPGSSAPAGDLRDIALSTQLTVHIAATAAAATALSCSPVPPLTPTAPTTWPLCRSGTPPAKIMMRPPLEACIP